VVNTKAITSMFAIFTYTVTAFVVLLYFFRVGANPCGIAAYGLFCFESRVPDGWQRTCSQAGRRIQATCSGTPGCFWSSRLLPPFLASAVLLPRRPES